MKTPSRRMLAACLLSAGSAWPTHATAMPSSASFSELAVPGLRWTASLSTVMSEVPIQIRGFSFSGEPVQLAQLYAGKPAYFQRVLIAAGSIVLSGLHHGEHWLAEMHATPSGARGQLSVMRIPQGVTGTVQPLRPSFSWLPAQARPLFNQHDSRASSTGKRAAVGQHVYLINLPAADTTAYVRRQLRRDGWEEEPSHDGPATHSAWRRKASRLALFSRPLPGGNSSLYVHHLQ